MTDEEQVQQTLAELWDIVKCRCNKAYTDRGLHDPDCECDSADAVQTVADAITTLRAQLAEARRLASVADERAYKYKMLAEEAVQYTLRAEQRVATLEAAIKIKGGNEHAPTQDAYDAACRAIEEHRARADRAEAALDAQIEVDAGIACKKCGASRAAWLKCSHIICLGGDAFGTQPHDRTALDRMLAEAREKALREAADVVDTYDRQDGGATKAILALIEAPKCA